MVVVVVVAAVVAAAVEAAAAVAVVAELAFVQPRLVVAGPPIKKTKFRKRKSK